MTEQHHNLRPGDHGRQKGGRGRFWKF